MTCMDADQPVRKNVTFSAELWARIDDWQFANRVKKDTEALRQLIELGLSVSKKQS